jgi:hypothetical protein
MARKPDAPGTYRIKRQSNGGWLLSGITTTGRRLKLPGLTYADAERTAVEVFGARPDSSALSQSQTAPIIGPITPTPTKTDDWGLPIGVSVDTAAQVNSALGIPNAPQATKVGTQPALSAPDNAEMVATKAKRAKQAKSIMELAGISFAAGSVWVGRRITAAAEKDCVNPNPTQVKDLAEVSKETFTEWFGDYDIKPWQMMFLLAAGIPLSMFIQSPKKKKVMPQPDLKAVP